MLSCTGHLRRMSLVLFVLWVCPMVCSIAFLMFFSSKGAVFSLFRHAVVVWTAVVQGIHSLSDQGGLWQGIWVQPLRRFVACWGQGGLHRWAGPMSKDTLRTVFPWASGCHDFCFDELYMSPKTVFRSFRRFLSTGKSVVSFPIYWRRYCRGPHTIRVGQGPWHICSFSFRKRPIR